MGGLLGKRAWQGAGNRPWRRVLCRIAKFGRVAPRFGSHSRYSAPSRVVGLSRVAVSCNIRLPAAVPAWLREGATMPADQAARPQRIPSLA